MAVGFPLLLIGGAVASGSSDGTDKLGAVLLIAGIAAIFGAGGLMVRHRMREPGATPESRAVMLLVVVIVLGALVYVIGRGMEESQQRSQEAERAIDCINNPSALNPACD